MEYNSSMKHDLYKKLVCDVTDLIKIYIFSLKCLLLL
jgi:hypothetical protein